MRTLLVSDTDATMLRTQGVDVVAWIGVQLKVHGFDLTREIIYHYDARHQRTIFMQHVSHQKAAA